MKMHGQTLIEMVVGLSVASIVVIAMTAVTLTSLSNASYGQDQNTATQYAQEGMEIVRAQRDQSPDTFWTTPPHNADTHYCLDGGQTTLPSPHAGSCTDPNVPDSNGRFVREIHLQPGNCANNLNKVTVEVKWADSKCPASDPFCHESHLVTCLE